MHRKPWLLLLIAGAAMLLETGLRLHHVGDHSMSHIEMYVPNIPMGTDLSVPKTRTWAPGGTPALALAPQFFLPRMMLFLFCVLLLVAGIRRLKPTGERLLCAANGTLLPSSIT
jgi:hypothetical protein